MDDGVFLILGLAYGLLPFLGLVSFLRQRKQAERIDGLERQIAGLRAEVAGLRGAAPPQSVAGPAAGPAAEIPLATPIEPPVRPEAGAEPPPESPPEPSEPATPPPFEPAPMPAAARLSLPSLESLLTGRWLVWIGGVALALGGAFLVQVSIESGLITPPVRILFGLALAVALVAGAEWLRRRPPARGVGPLGPDHLTPSAAGAGVAVAYAAIYAAYGLYGLIAQLSAFVGMALVSLVAVGLGLLHGPAVAALGIAGALAVPLVVGGESKDGAALFAYLASVVAVGGFAARWRGWAWALLMAHGGGILWVLVWIVSSIGREPWTAMLFVPAAGVLAAALRRRPEEGGAEEGRALDRIGAAHAGLTLLGTLALLFATGDAGFAMALGVAAAALLMVDERAGTRLTGGTAAALLALLAAVASVHENGGPWQFPLVLAPAFAAATFALAHGSVRADWFALLGAVGPALLVALGYALWTEGEPDAGWALIAAAVAALHVALAAVAARWRDDPTVGERWSALLAAHATAALAGVALGAAFILRDAWLSVALAATVAGAAWVHRSVPVAGLRHAALVLAGIVIVRLAANPDVFGYPLGGPLPGVSWIWTGYGLSALAFVAARRGFGEAASLTLRTVLEGGALTFLILLVSFQFRLSVGGDLAHPGYSLLEQSLNSAWWLSVALFLYARAGHSENPTVRWGWRVLGLMGAVQVLVGHLILDNPLVTDDPVGEWPVANLLLLAYAVPAVLAGGFAWVAAWRGHRRLGLAAGGGALLTAWVWLSLSVRHAFHGTHLEAGAVTDGEMYSYSVAWLAFGGALLAVGLWRGSQLFRYASLILILASVAKVFLVDLSALAGLWRAVSFIGLGAALLGIGLVYQRFVLVRPSAAGPALEPDPGTR